ncbi:MAG: HD domain-containing protein [Chloroflexi bacterium]|nr:HD domain-containing protein [Chloroflexota bacterium]
MGTRYRFRQFIAAVAAKVEPEELPPLRQYLGPAELRLFRAMPVQDQRHCLNVFVELRRAGYEDKPLLQAALLHDVGKGGVGLGVWHRVAIVLLKALAPRLLSAIASHDKGSWRYPFWVHRHHAGLGASVLRQAGSSARVVELVLGHHSPSQDPLAHALWQVDGQN